MSGNNRILSGQTDRGIKNFIPRLILHMEQEKNKEKYSCHLAHQILPNSL